jgi:argininosuccinate lyase
MDARRIGLGFACLVGMMTGDAMAQSPPRDAFHWIGEMNKASAVMVVETGIVDRALGRSVAAAVAQVIVEGARPGAQRPADYLLVERQLVAAGGPEVTRMHSGRSRQDMGSTTHRLFLRDAVLDNAAALNAARAAILGFARTAPDAIMPAYTMGVQAQPITLGHYLGGYLGALERQGERLRQSYARLNLSPLGGAAVGTSSFPVDRVRLAALLGFDGPVRNSFDGNHVSPYDLNVEMAGLATGSAITIGALMTELLDQYRQARPWFLLAAEDMGSSSIMPQKRNPVPLLNIRTQAGRVVGAAQTAVLVGHNVAPGALDTRGDDARAAILEAARMQAAVARLFPTLRFDRVRALEEVEGDYATSTELADVLQREADVPFRVGHHFASELVNYGRSNGLRPADLPFEAAQRIYADTAEHMLGTRGAAFPLPEARFRSALTAENMVRSSRGLGGPQPEEVASMLDALAARLAADEAWLNGRRAALAEASARLEAAFAGLRN